MSRTLSSAAVQSLFVSQTDEVWVMLIKITHPLITDITVTSDNIVTVHSGETYEPYPYEIRMPSDVPNTMPVMDLQIDNVERRLVETIRSLPDSPDVVVKFVLADTPDVIEAGPFVFQMANTRFDALAVSATLIYQDILHEPYPADRITPQHFPGVF